MTGSEPGVELSTTPSGVRVVSEHMPEARSVSLGVWVGVGSRDEPAELAGASHFLEHLLFKGTADRTAREIAIAVEARGGEMNAFTSRESTAFHLRLPASELAFGLELLAEVVATPALRAHEVDAEREVILEELAMAEDTPDDLVNMRLYEHVFDAHPLGRETLGSEDSLERLTPDGIAAFHAEWYRPANLVVAVAGACTHEQVLTVLDRTALAHELPPGGDRPSRRSPGVLGAPLTVEHRQLEQVQLALGWRGLHLDDPDRYALALGVHILGGGMASRLFQEVREERGLAYTVYATHSMYSDAGIASVAAGTAPQRVDEVLQVIDRVLAELLDEGVTDDELATAKGFVEGATLLGLEDSGSRMNRLGGSVLVRGRVVPVEEQLAHLRAVSTADADRALRRVFGGPRVLAAVGACTPDDAALRSAVDRGRAQSGC